MKIKSKIILLTFFIAYLSCQSNITVPLEELKIDFSSTQKTINESSRKITAFSPSYFKIRDRIVIYYPNRSEVYIMNLEGELLEKKEYGKLNNPYTVIEYSKTASAFKKNLYLLFHDHITILNIHTLEEKTIAFKFPKSPSEFSHFHFISEDEFLLSFHELKKEKSELSFYKGNLKTGTFDLIINERVDGLKPPFGASKIFHDQLAFVKIDESKIRFFDFSGNLQKEIKFEKPSKYTFRETSVFYSNEIHSAPDLPFSDKFTDLDIFEDKLYLTYKLFTKDIKNKYQNTAMMMVYDLKSSIKKEFEQPAGYYMMAGNGQFFSLMNENDQAILEYKILKKEFSLE